MDKPPSLSKEHLRSVAPIFFCKKEEDILCKSHSVDCPMLADILWFSTGSPKFKISSAKLIRLLFVKIRYKSTIITNFVSLSISSILSLYI